MKRIAYIFIILYFAISQTLVYADFDDTGAGGRAVGMGGAFVAVADDPFGLYYNPAGLGFVRQGQIGFDYNKMWVGLDDGSNLNTAFVSVLVPFFKAASGNAQEKDSRAAEKKKIEEKKKAKEKLLKMLQGGNGKPQNEADKKEGQSLAGAENADGSSSAVPPVETKEGSIRHTGTFALGFKQFSLLDYYQESTYYLGYGRTIKDRFAWGINLKALNEKYTMDAYTALSPVFEYGAKDSVNAYSLDIGLLYNVLPRLFVGVSATDLNQPSVGLQQEDTLPSLFRCGVAWRQKQIKWALDGIYRSGRWYGATGMEKWFKDVFAVHGGFSFGGKNYIHSALGFSVNFSAAQLDYTFQLPLAGIKDTAGSHQMSLVYRFGRRPKDELEPGSLELYYAKLQDEMTTLKKSLEEVNIEKKKLEEVLIEESTMRIRERIRAAKAGGAPAVKPEEKKSATQDTLETSHIVQKGETLQSISKKYYGDEKYWNKIYQENKDDIGRGGVLKHNQVLLIPPLSRSVLGEQSVQRSPLQPALAPAPESVPLIEVKPTASQEVIKKIEIPAPETPKKEIKKQTAAGPRTHRVIEGENLQSISQQYYNTSKRWKDIYKANKDKIIGGQVAPGQELLIP